MKRSWIVLWLLVFAGGELAPAASAGVPAGVVRALAGPTAQRGAPQKSHGAKKKKAKAPKKAAGKKGANQGRAKPKAAPLPRPTQPAEPRPPLYPQAPGVAGERFPDVLDLRTLSPLHEDEDGEHEDGVQGAPHAVLGAAARPGGGFGVLWSDERSGAPAWFVSELSTEGIASLASEVADAERAGVDLARARALFAYGAAPEPYLGWIAATSAALDLGHDQPLPLDPRAAAGSERQAAPAREEPAARGPANARGARSKPQARAEQPATARKAALPPYGDAAFATLSDGTICCAWQRGAQLELQRFSANGEAQGQVETVAVGEASITPHVVAVPGGVALVLWSAGDAVHWLESRAPGRRRSGQAGGGTLLSAVPARAADGGFVGLWLAVSNSGELVLRRLAVASNDGSGARAAAEGARRGKAAAVAQDVPAEPRVVGDDQPFRGANDGLRVELALTTAGPIALVDPGEGRPVELRFFDGRGALQGQAVRPFVEPDPQPQASISAQAPAPPEPDDARLVVADGAPWLIWSWRDAVFARRVDAATGAFSAPEVRLDPARDDSHQRAVRIASSGFPSERVRAVWIDERSGVPRPVLSLALGDADAVAAQDGAARAKEIPLPVRYAANGETEVAAPDDTARFAGQEPAPHGISSPELAVAGDGVTLVAWNEARDPGHVLRAQLLDARGAALGPDTDLDPQQGLARDERAALVALRMNRGFAAAWVREDGSLMLRHVAVGSASAALGPATWLAGGPRGGGGVASSPAATVLDDNRVAVVWLEQRGKPRLRGRVLESDLRVVDLPFDIEPGPGDFDGAPSVAPGADHGFALAWESGAVATRDVYVRFFAGSGAPQTAALAVSTAAGRQQEPRIARLANHDWAIVWRDDLSGTALPCVRRVAADRSRLGPARTLGGARAGAVGALDVAPVGSGLCAVWSGGGRDRGLDAWAALVGPAFDASSPALLPLDPAR